MYKIRLSGKDWYLEKHVAQQLGCKNSKELREKFHNFTYYALSVKQREQLIDAGLAPRSIRTSGVFVSCEDVDPFLEKIEGAITNGPDNSLEDIIDEASRGSKSETTNNLVEQDIPLLTVRTSSAPALVNDSHSATPNTMSLHPRDISYPDDCAMPALVKLEPMDESHSACSCNCTCSHNNDAHHYDHAIANSACTVNTPSKPVGNSYQMNAPAKNASDIKSEAKFVCRDCPFMYEFVTEDVYLRHMKMAHPQLMSGGKIKGSRPKSSSDDQPCSSDNRNADESTSSESVFTCRVCYIHFDCVDSLHLHQTVTQHLYSIFHCKFCAAICLSEPELDQHVLKAHPDSADLQLMSIHRCIVEGCVVTFDGGNELVEHVNKCHRNKVFICGTCFLMFRYREGLNVHLKSTQHAAPATPTDVIDDSIDLSAKRRWVTALHRRYSCEFCGRTFSLSLNFQKHRTKCTGVPVQRYNASRNESKDQISGRSYPCSLCEKTFNDRNQLLIHGEEHGLRCFKCTTCGKIFKSHSSFWLHKKTHVNNGLWVRCDYCPRVFRSTKSWKRHVEVFHPKEKAATWNCICEICNKAFRNETCLRIHKFYHFGAKANKSKVEGNGSDVVHETADSSDGSSALERPAKPELICSFCSKQFHFYQNFRDHMDSHTHVRRHTCEKCSKSFTYSSALCAHKKKPCSKEDFSHSCQLCGDVFRSQKSLTFHMARIHMTKELTCSRCNEKVLGQRNLLDHCRQFHPDVSHDHDVTTSPSLPTEAANDDQSSLVLLPCSDDEADQTTHNKTDNSISLNLSSMSSTT